MRVACTSHERGQQLGALRLDVLQRARLREPRVRPGRQQRAQAQLLHQPAQEVRLLSIGSRSTMPSCWFFPVCLTT